MRIIYTGKYKLRIENVMVRNGGKVLIITIPKPVVDSLELRPGEIINIEIEKKEGL